MLISTCFVTFEVEAMSPFFPYKYKWMRAALCLVPGEMCILAREGAIHKLEVEALEMAGCSCLESEDNETDLGM